MPWALETRTVTVSWLPRSIHNCSGWSSKAQGVKMLAGSLVQWLIHLWSTRESLRAHWFRLLSRSFHTWTQWTLNVSSVSARDQSRPGSPPLMLKHKFRVNKNRVYIKQRGGGEPGDEASSFNQIIVVLCGTLIRNIHSASKEFEAAQRAEREAFIQVSFNKSLYSCA